MSTSPRLLSPSTAAWLLAALGVLAPAVGHAQYENHCGPCVGIDDYQYFEPVDLDLDCQPIRFDCGYFFNYDKLYWAITGERVTVGDQNTLVNAQIIFPPNSAVSEAAAATNPAFLLPGGGIPQPPGTYVLQNAIQSGPPNTEFGYADRYEFGYVGEDGGGILLGVLLGNEVNSQQLYGFESPTTNGFGSVAVTWRGQSTLLQGFRDFGGSVFELDDDINVGSDGDDAAGVGPTIGGPAIGGDGVIDDILFNGGTFFIIDVNNNGEFDFGVDQFYIDYGDVSEFNFVFDTLAVRNLTKTDGFEIMRTHQLSNRHFMAKHQNQRLEIGYGARIFRLKDTFIFDGNASNFGRTFIQTETDNQIVGPQIRLKWQAQTGRWNLAVDGRCMLGYNIGDLNQTFGIGQNLTPGGLNQPLVLQPTYGDNGFQENTFSPMVELRADLKYQVTRAVAVNVGYTAMFVDNVSRASQVVDYVLPRPNLLQGGNQEVFINGVNLGVEFVH